MVSSRLDLAKVVMVRTTSATLASTIFTVSAVTITPVLALMVAADSAFWVSAMAAVARRAARGEGEGEDGPGPSLESVSDIASS